MKGIQFKEVQQFRQGWLWYLLRVHNVDGKNGYPVILKNGKNFFFGTQRKLTVENVLQQTGKLKL